MFVRNGQALGSVLHSAVPGAEPAEPETEAEPVPEPVESDAPSQHDLKADWVDYAVSKGLDRDEAEELTKAELIELYGG